MTGLLHKLFPLVALALNLVLLGATLAPDRKSPRNRIFAYLTCALAVWNLGVFGLRATADPETALVWERILHLGVIPIPALFYHYVLAFLDVPRRRPSLVFAYAACFFFLTLSPTPAFLTGVRDTPWGYAPVVGPLYAPFVFYLQAYLVAGIVWLVRAYRSVRANFRKNRTLLVILGASVSVLGGVIDFARFIFDWEHLYPPGIPTNAIFALALGIALVRYRLFDLGVLVKRSVLYLGAGIALSPVLLVTLFAVDQVAPDEMPGDHLPLEARYALILVLALLVALPVLRKLEGGLERLIFQRKHGVRDALLVLSKDMTSLLDVAKLGDTLTRGLTTRIPVRHAALHLRDAGDRLTLAARASAGDEEAAAAEAGLDDSVLLWLKITGRTFVVEEAAYRAVSDVKTRAAVSALEAARVALVVPLFVDAELDAILVVGEKLSGELFDPDEIGLLETLASETSVALRNARLYEDLRLQMEQLRSAQAQLMQSAKLAAIGELAASIAHELVTPLTVIRRYAERVSGEMPAGTASHERLLIMETQAERAHKIVQDVLDFARRRERKPAPVDVPEVIRRSLKLVDVKLTMARVEAQTLFDPSVPLVMGDRDELTQVFVNLFSNAVDAMPHGGRLVIATDVRVEDGRSWLRASVADTGVGMEPEQVALIFDPFYTTKPDGQGTGLGLSVTAGIIKKHGGSVEVESARGKGTTMIVLLPLPAGGGLGR